MKRSFQYLLGQKWNSKIEIRLLIVFTLIGFVCSFFSYHLLNGYKYNSGKNLIGAFFPSIICVVFTVIKAFNVDLEDGDLFKIAISYFIQLIPFIPLFLQIFQPTPQDDFSRSCLYARNMIDNKTLWGGDKLFFSNTGYYYVTQPGYRYFIALELLCFKYLYRFICFINIAIYIIAIFYSIKLIQKQTDRHQNTQRILLLLILLTTPYAVKNILMGLSEWLTIILLMISGYVYFILKRQGLSAVILSLVPFLRQNLLVTIILIAFFMMMKSHQKVRFSLCFIFFILLPLYHNLYYAHKWQFFVDIFQVPFLQHSIHSNGSIDYNFLIKNLVHYFGLDIESGNIYISAIAIIFVPLSVYVYVILLRRIPSFNAKCWYLAITSSAIIPVIFLGSEYYPRFEFVNVFIMLFTFILINSFYSNNLFLKNHFIKLTI